MFWILLHGIEGVVEELVAPGTLGNVNTNGLVYLPGHLLFSDSENKTVSYYSLNLATRKATVIWTGHTFGGMTLHPNRANSLYVADHTCACVSRVEGRLHTDEVTVTELTERQSKGVPNGVIVRSDGTVYYTFTTGKLYSLRLDGQVVQETASAAGWPNGLAFSPSEATLYVSLSLSNGIDAYDATRPSGALGTPEAVIRDPELLSPIVDEIATAPATGEIFAATGSECVARYNPGTRAQQRIMVKPHVRTVGVLHHPTADVLYVATAPGGVYAMSTAELGNKEPQSSIQARRSIGETSWGFCAMLAVGAVVGAALVAIVRRTLHATGGTARAACIV